MGTMVKTGNRLIRINTNNPKQLEYSEDGGNNWNYLQNHNYMNGDVFELTSSGNEIIAATSDGMYYSNDGYGNYWNRR
jgi:hypothetical protein